MPAGLLYFYGLAKGYGDAAVVGPFILIFVAYAATVLMGVPAYLMMKKKRIHSFAAYILFGGLVGFVFSVLLTVVDTYPGQFFAVLRNSLGASLVATLYSATAAAVFWVITVWRSPKGPAVAAHGFADEKSDWSMLQWESEGGPVLLQSRDAKPEDKRGLYETAVVMEWRFAAAGLPDEATMSCVYLFEDALEAIRNEGVAVHVHTLTGNGLREWCYYTGNYPAFETRLNEVLASLPKLPIEVSFQADPQWDYWRKARSLTS